MKYRRALEQCLGQTYFSLSFFLLVLYDNEVGTRRRCISDKIRGRGKINERRSFERKRYLLVKY